MNNLIYKKSNFNEWLLPEKVYHGTTDKYVESILKEGLKINHEEKNSALSLPLIYLTTSIEMAKDFAKSVSFKKQGNPIILEIDSESLVADSMCFDLNISLRLCSQCITYQENIKTFKVIKDLDYILPGKMIFNDPLELTTPVVWNLKEKRTIEHLKLIGYDDRNIIENNSIFQVNSIGKKNKL